MLVFGFLSCLIVGSISVGILLRIGGISPYCPVRQGFDNPALHTLVCPPFVIYDNLEHDPTRDGVENERVSCPAFRWKCKLE